MRSLRSPEPISDLRVAALLGLCRAGFAVLDARHQDRHRAILVLVLRTAVLAFGNDAGRQVGDAHRRLGLVDVLAAGAGGAVDVDADILGADDHVADLVGLGHHRDGAGRGMDAPLRLGFRHPLHAVPAGLELEFRIHAAADQAHDHFLVAAQVGGVFGDQLDLPAVALCVAGVHAEQRPGEQRRFVAAGAGADFQKNVFLVVGILGQQRALQVFFQGQQVVASGADLLFAERFHLRVSQDLLGFGDVGFACAVALIEPDHRRQLGVLARQPAVAVQVAGRCFARQQGIELGKPARELRELGRHAGFHR